MRGWMAAVRRMHDPYHPINGYTKLRQLFRFFAVWNVLDWDEGAANQLQRLRLMKTQVGTMDLKIASVVLARGGKLLSRNSSDFGRVPGLVVEDWLS